MRVIVQTALVSERGAVCVMRRPASWPKASVTVVGAGTAVAVSWEGGGETFFSFATAAGGAYTLSGA